MYKLVILLIVTILISGCSECSIKPALKEKLDDIFYKNQNKNYKLKKYFIYDNDSNLVEKTIPLIYLINFENINDSNFVTISTSYNYYSSNSYFYSINDSIKASSIGIKLLGYNIYRNKTLVFYKNGNCSTDLINIDCLKTIDKDFEENYFDENEIKFRSDPYKYKYYIYNKDSIVKVNLH